MALWEKDVLEVTLEKDHWKEPDPLIGGHKWQAIRESSEMKVRKTDGNLVRLKFLKGSIVQIIPKKIIYDPNDLIDGTLEP